MGKTVEPMHDFEKLGLFYLGKTYDVKDRKVTSELVLYESKHLTTHAVCVGMTGSGKTGLGIGLLEEAAIDGIPVIAIDPKGDLSNLLLGFPELRPEDFLPWVDTDEAGRRGQTVEQFAAKTADQWKEGLAAWGEDGGRIARMQDAVDLAIYTPGSSAGLSLSVLRSFDAPPAALVSQAELYRERIASAVSGLLALLGIAADPISSREHILLSNILDQAWRNGQDLDMASLIHAVQSPPLQKVGVMDIETFFPAKDRFALAMKINNLLASPGFAGWLEGDALDVGSLLYTPDGKPKLSVVSIAHLSDNERMFFITILLNEVLAWVRTQPGTSSLRAVLYMDEIFGYFPPTANPPSKVPMLTLLKQARAFGLGVVLATQNPVDLDYKGLSNAGTWFLGRLQTARDKDRVLEGLEGASTAAGHAFDRKKMDEILSGLGSRVFVMNNVHEDQPVVFQTRWTLSYLRGPLTREQIQTLMAPRKQASAPGPAKQGSSAPATTEAPPAALTTAGSPASPSSTATVPAGSGARPVMPPDVPEFFVPRRARSRAGESLLYRPALLGVTRLHYADRKAGVDYWETLVLVRRIEDAMPGEPWDASEPFDDGVPELDKTPEAGARFDPLPAELSRAKSYAGWIKSLKSFLYRERTLRVWNCPALKEWSRPLESEREFRLRLVQASREQRDHGVEALRAKYAPKLEAIQEQMRRAREKLDREQAQASKTSWDATIALGGSVLGAILGRKAITKTSVGRATTAAKAATRAAQQRGDVSQAASSFDALRQKHDDLQAKFQAEIEAMAAALRPEALALEPLPIRPRKTDITVEKVVLAWMPYQVGSEGRAEAVY
jgi:Skp family chaperone for outer membrane proteins